MNLAEPCPTPQNLPISGLSSRSSCEHTFWSRSTITWCQCTSGWLGSEVDKLEKATPGWTCQMTFMAVLRHAGKAQIILAAEHLPFRSKLQGKQRGGPSSVNLGFKGCLSQKCQYASSVMMYGRLWSSSLTVLRTPSKNQKVSSACAVISFVILIVIQKAFNSGEQATFQVAVTTFCRHIPSPTSSHLYVEGSRCSAARKGASANLTSPGYWLWKVAELGLQAGTWCASSRRRQQ